MSYDRFLIAPYDDGMRTDLEPWLIPDQSFSEMFNAYVWRGRIRKRFGGRLMGVGSTSSLDAPLFSRLRIAIPAPLTLGGGVGVGITSGVGTATNPALPVPWPQYKIGQFFQIGAFTYTITALGAAALTPSPGAPATIYDFDSTTGVYNFTTAGNNLQIYFYPNGNNVTTAAGIANGVVDGAPYTIGRQFSIGDVIFTVNDSAAGDNQMLRTDGSIEPATFNLATGEFHITIAALPHIQVYFYPALPVMGLANYKYGAINGQPTYGFDTQFAYVFTGYWQRVGEAQGVQFHGTNNDFFWTCNWNGITDNQTALFVTNFNVLDPIWYFNQYLVVPWAQFAPAVTAAPNPVTIIRTARIIVCFKDRLVLLNTVERTGGNDVSYTNRCRYSHNGSPFDANAFIQVNNTGFQGGGYIDAPTEEQIISAEFIKDRLIVYFERSTYELAYTGNQVLPFVWQKLNTELGAESTFSAVPFDTAVLGIGNTGVHACNGSNVERIDIKIPNSIFEIVNKNEGVSRVVGIRDYYTEMVYWTFPNVSEAADVVYPNQVLVYNYKTNSWAFNDDCITFFGYLEQQQDVAWSQLSMEWQENDATWNAGILQSQFRQVIAGNQQGYTFIVDSNQARNAPVMSITDMNALAGLLYLKVIDHVLAVGDFVFFHDCTGTAGLDGNIFEVQAVIDTDNFAITMPSVFVGNYLGGGNITRISRIEMYTKQFNPYVDKGRDVYISKIDFNVLSTEYGEIRVDYNPSTSQLSMIDEGTATGTILGTGILETFPYPTIPFEQQQTKLWHPVYFQSGGEFIQLSIYLDDEQMVEPNIVFSPFQLEGMVLHTMPTSSRLE